MKIVVNNDWGMFVLPKKFLYLDKQADEKGLKEFTNEYNVFVRTNKELIAYIESDKYIKDFDNTKFEPLLGVVEIPDDTTDWIIQDYDGWEWVLYVQNGKIYITDKTI